MASKQLFTLLLLSSVISSISSISMNITGPNWFEKWGPWGSMEFCPSHTYVQGFQLKTHRTDPNELSVDRTGLNGIRLFCGDPSQSTTVQLTSLIGDFGDWGKVFTGPGVLNGFQLRLEEPMDGNDPSADDLAVTNIRAFCTGPAKQTVGDGLDQGDWKEEKHCNKGQGVCGLETKVQRNQGHGDDTALLNVKMQCCDMIGAGWMKGQ